MPEFCLLVEFHSEGPVPAACSTHKRLLLVSCSVSVVVIQYTSSWACCQNRYKKQTTWIGGFKARSSAPADKECCCLHFALISLSFRPSSLKESEICCCSAPSFKTVNSSFFNGSCKQAGPQPTVQHTMSTTSSVVQNIWFGWYWGLEGDFLMAQQACFLIIYKGWEPTFDIGAFGLFEELSTQVGNNGFKSKDPRFGMKKKIICSF